MGSKFEHHHWRHYFGGVAVVLLVLQVLTGVFLALYYNPDMPQAYGSVRDLYRNFAIGAWIRDSHRWIAFFVVVVSVVHVTRSLLRRDFLNYAQRTVWLTGVLLLVPILALLVTGFILPWEWKAYWFMEMVPNYLDNIAFVGPTLKTLALESFSLNRNFIAHAVILPVIAYILIEFHILAKMRKRKTGISMYIVKHAIISVPFIVAVGALAVSIPMPSLDPEMIPMPLEGTNIPSPEWFALFFLRPFVSFEGTSAAFLAFYLPLILFVIILMLPYAFGRRKKVQPQVGTSSLSGTSLLSRAASGLSRPKLFGALTSLILVSVVVLGFFSLLFVQVQESPTLGCNSCHNLSMGNRMGIPPEAYKDRNIVPLTGDTQWMVEHWFYPQVAW